MLLEAQNLTRYYGRLPAVQGVSFGIERGEIVGLLGPNGAGKTTTMRMLAGFLRPTHGSAAVAGIDVARRPRDAHRHIGYMPENNPLYPEMRVREYLAFRAELKGLPRKHRRARIGRCVDLCKLTDVVHQVIGTLSKGYRQRVGLADVMLAEPDVLILDEPTIGLDPGQVAETRDLIRDLSAGHTVLVSTHILAEAEAICRRVLIIVGGRLVADDTPERLSEGRLRARVEVEIRAEAREVVAALAGLDGVEDVTAAGGNGWRRFRVSARAGLDVRPAIARTAAARGWPLRELTVKRPSLEEIFLHITRAPQHANGREQPPR